MSHDQKDDKTVRFEQFQGILARQQQQAYRVRTREEDVQQHQDQQLVAQVAGYTPDAIVRGLADLQLEVDTTVNQLSDRLRGEFEKQEHLQRAIAVARQQQQQLHDLGIVADYLYLLRGEHAEKRRQLRDRMAQEYEALDKRRQQTRKRWQQQQQQHQEAWEAKRQQRQKQRQQEEADAAYHQQQQRQRDADDYARAAREQEIELAQQGQMKQKDWTAREAVLAAHQAEIERDRASVAGFEEELTQAFETAKTEAIQEVHRQSRSRRELLEKTWQGHEQGYQVKLESLEAVLAQQDRQLAEINAQLQEARQQARALSVQAFS
ncbi:MAG: hypothetical protein ACLFM4_06760 [Phormidium sp.]|nr:MAG: DNA methylase [Phormidium sp. OSCR]